MSRYNRCGNAGANLRFLGASYPHLVVYNCLENIELAIILKGGVVAHFVRMVLVSQWMEARGARRTRGAM